MKKFGYQGAVGSNSEVASQVLAQKMKFENVEFVPLLTSQGVTEALKNKDIDFGVFATNNILAGEVLETTEALKNLSETHSYGVVENCTLPIEHYLFVANNEVLEIDFIASHIQALHQCESTINKLYPNAKWKELGDTAIGAKYLCNGTLDKNVAVICRNNAGEMYNLHLLHANIQDNKENATDFALVAIIK